LPAGTLLSACGQSILQKFYFRSRRDALTGSDRRVTLDSFE
jgi:hypothetical protein